VDDYLIVFLVPQTHSVVSLTDDDLLLQVKSTRSLQLYAAMHLDRLEALIELMHRFQNNNDNNNHHNNHHNNNRVSWNIRHSTVPCSRVRFPESNEG
jgi:hypothetical protein